MTSVYNYGIIFVETNIVLDSKSVFLADRAATEKHGYYTTFASQ